MQSGLEARLGHYITGDHRSRPSPSCGWLGAKYSEQFLDFCGDEDPMLSCCVARSSGERSKEKQQEAKRSKTALPASS